METDGASSDKVVVRWSEQVAGRYGAASLVLAAISVIAWLLFGGYGGVVFLGAGVLTGVFSGATFVVSRVGSMLGRTIESIDRDAAHRGSAPA